MIDPEKKEKQHQQYVDYRINKIGYHLRRLMSYGLKRKDIDKMLTNWLKENKLDDTKTKKADKSFSNEKKRKAFKTALQYNLDRVDSVGKTKCKLVLKLGPYKNNYMRKRQASYYGYIIDGVVKPCKFKEMATIPCYNNAMYLEEYSRIISITPKEFDKAKDLIFTENQEAQKTGWQVLSGFFNLPIDDLQQDD